MKYIYYSILFLFISTLTLSAQGDNLDSEWYNLDRNRNFYEIQESFNEHWKDKNITSETPKEERGGWKQFKRWEWFWEQRVYPSGVFPTAGHVYNEYLKYRNSESKDGDVKKQSTTWSHLGPNTSTGGYQGLGRINCVVEHPDYDGSTNQTIWVGSASGGIWKTTDGGSNWSTNTDDLSVLGIGDMVIDPDNPSIMYVAQAMVMLPIHIP